MNRNFTVLFLFLLITGCDDIEQRREENKLFILAVLARPAGRIQPLPETKAKTISHHFDFRKDLFMPILERRQEFKNGTSCYTPEERGFPQLYSEKSLDDLTFLRYRRIAESFSVTFWDGKEIEILQKNTLISKDKWQLVAVDTAGVTVAQLDQCGQIKNSKMIQFSD